MCVKLDNVFSAVWQVTVNTTLVQLFEQSEELSRDEKTYTRLVEALPTEKQQVLTLLELITFFTGDEAVRDITDTFSKMLKENHQDKSLFSELKQMVQKAFLGIPQVRH